MSEKRDYTDYIDLCVSNLEENNEAKSYLLNRGLTEDTIRRFRLGYDDKHYFKQDKKTHKAIVIPYNKKNSYYCVRVIEGIEDTQVKIDKPRTEEAGYEPIFNADALDGTDCVFVTEGPFDAISIEQLGYKAIALGGGGQGKLIEYLKNMGDKKPVLILLFDSDDAGKAHGERASKELFNIGTLHTIETIEKYKDPNEALIESSEYLSDFLRKAVLLKDIKAKSPDNNAIYISSNFTKDLESFNKYESIKTGFTELDKCIGGGLCPGLYVLGAATSVGKTTFCHQMACEIAFSKNHVLFFSLEMSKFEMVSRGIARTLARKESEKKESISSLKIRQGHENKVVELAAKEFAEYAGHYMNDIQCEFGFSVDDIKKYTESFITRNNQSPVIFIDYLQILSSPSSNQSTRREEIDEIITSLKRFSNEYRLPVFLVSAINRGNYILPVSLESFKESGGIEYTADVVLGLQLSCFSEDNIFNGESKTTEKRKKIQESLNSIPRKVDILILKNRFGVSGGNIKYQYYSNCDLFESERTHGF